jgi:hypothetical protein
VVIVTLELYVLMKESTLAIESVKLAAVVNERKRARVRVRESVIETRVELERKRATRLERKLVTPVVVAKALKRVRTPEAEVVMVTLVA